MVSQDSALSLLRSLVKELRSHNLPGAAKKKKREPTEWNNFGGEQYRILLHVL